MTYRELFTAVGVLVLGAMTWSSSTAASLPAAYEACEEAIASELGDGKLRTSVLQNSRQNGVGYHWINVRHRATHAERSERYRVRCETGADSAVADIEVAAGAWKKTHRNKAPRPVD